MAAETVVAGADRLADTGTTAAARRQLGRAIWLLIILREWLGPGESLIRGGSSVRSGELAEALGIGERQARRDLQRLRESGYVELQNTGRGFKIRLTGGKAV